MNKFIDVTDMNQYFTNYYHQFEVDEFCNEMAYTEIRKYTQLTTHHGAQDKCTLHNNSYFETNQINSPQKPFTISLDYDFIMFHEH